MNLLKTFKHKIKNKLINFFFEALKQEVQNIFLTEPMIVGPKERLHISENVKKNNFLVNTNSGEVYVNDYVFFGKNVCLITGTHDFTKFEDERRKTSPKEGRDIVIEKGVWIATNATIIGPCIIGKNAVVAAGSVVTKNVEPFTVVGGVPAKIIKRIQQKEDE
ncbi:acyltransferase [Myxosarcina sp. GI1]|uniref:acyltransferase n=1 Tax=Myxosarcina sp. GI1 TaxID=1541065 RepID=UPI000564745A|nr:acyltransferase [Myxosarcina sp. GI1]